MRNAAAKRADAGNDARGLLPQRGQGTRLRRGFIPSSAAPDDTLIMSYVKA